MKIKAKTVYDDIVTIVGFVVDNNYNSEHNIRAIIVDGKGNLCDYSIKKLLVLQENE